MKLSNEKMIREKGRRIVLIHIYLKHTGRLLFVRELYHNLHSIKLIQINKSNEVYWFTMINVWWKLQWDITNTLRNILYLLIKQIFSWIYLLSTISYFIFFYNFPNFTNHQLNNFSFPAFSLILIFGSFEIDYVFESN